MEQDLSLSAIKSISDINLQWVSNPSDKLTRLKLDILLSVLIEQANALKYIMALNIKSMIQKFEDQRLLICLKAINQFFSFSSQ